MAWSIVSREVGLSHHLVATNDLAVNTEELLGGCGFEALINGMLELLRKLTSGVRNRLGVWRNLMDAFRLPRLAT